MRTAGIVLLAGLALSGAAPDPFAGRVAGKPVRCITDGSTSGPTILDDRNILYQGTGRIWKVQPVGECRSLGPFKTLVVVKYGSQTCANDRFRVLEPGTTIPSAYCRFGQFVPYTKAKR